MIKDLVEQLNLTIMDSQNIIYLIETLLDFETILSIKTTQDYSGLIQNLFYLVKASVSNLMDSKLLLNVLKKYILL